MAEGRKHSPRLLDAQNEVGGVEFQQRAVEPQLVQGEFRPVAGAEDQRQPRGPQAKQ